VLHDTIAVVDDPRPRALLAPKVLLDEIVVEDDGNDSNESFSEAGGNLAPIGGLDSAGEEDEEEETEGEPMDLS
jgi:hypothetical protein